jgi:hypothetical protein
MKGSSPVKVLMLSCSMEWMRLSHFTEQAAKDARLPNLEETCHQDCMSKKKTPLNARSTRQNTLQPWNIERKGSPDRARINVAWEGVEPPDLHHPTHCCGDR